MKNFREQALKMTKVCLKKYDKNLEQLKKNKPELYAIVKDYKSEERFKMVPDVNNEVFNLYINQLNKNYYESNNLLYNVKLKIDALKIKNARLAIFFGIGLGYELLYFLKEVSKIQKTRKVLVIEKDLEIFIYAMHAIDMGNIIRNENIELVIGKDFVEIARFYDTYFKKMDTISLVKASAVIYYPTAMEMNKTYYMENLKIYKENIKYALRYYGNSPEDSLIGLRHMFDNVKEIIDNPGINLLYNKFKDKPAIVVASGPSLKKNIHQLHAIKDKVLIISAQSTLKILLDYGIKPHIVTTLERVPETTKSFVGLDEDEVKDIYLAACPVIPKEAYEAYKGPRIVVYRKFDHFKWLKLDKGMLDIKLSSANMAFKIGEAVGCNPIILIGQDLAFSREDGTTHMAQHIMGDNQKQYTEKNRIEVMGNDGEPILTSPTWYAFLESYVVDVRDYKGTCINATEGGAFIKGTVVMSLKEAVEKYVVNVIEPLPTIKKALDKFDRDSNEVIYNDLYSRLTVSIEDVGQITEICNQAMEIISSNYTVLNKMLKEESFTKEENEWVTDINNEIMGIRNTIYKVSDTFQLLIMHIVQPIYIKYDIDLYEIPGKYEKEEQGLAASVLFMMKWYVVVKEIIQIIKEELILTKDKLKQEE